MEVLVAVLSSNTSHITPCHTAPIIAMVFRVNVVCSAWPNYCYHLHIVWYSFKWLTSTEIVCLHLCAHAWVKLCVCSCFWQSHMFFSSEKLVLSHVSLVLLYQLRKISGSKRPRHWTIGYQSSSCDFAWERFQPVPYEPVQYKYRCCQWSNKERKLPYQVYIPSSALMEQCDI